MKRIIPLLLALLLLSACVRTPQPPAEPEQTEAPAPVQTEAAAQKKEDPEMNGEIVTLEGLDAYLRLTLPEGWSWTEGETGDARRSLLLQAPTDDGFQVSVCWWSFFGMCGTGVEFRELELPNGMKATLATEKNAEEVCQTLILPDSPEQFTLQIAATQEQLETHQSELDAILASLRIGELTHIPPQPKTPTSDI